jgi:ribonuclease G
MYEIQDSEKIVGCIFKGRVANVVAGTQSAFVDIGIHKDAYLTLTGVESGDGDEDLKDIFRSPIQDTLKVGQEVVLQILKEPTPTKGPRSTMTISFPGRYLVFMPKVDHIGVSRRIPHDRERDRLRAIGKRIAPKGSGVVFRTASEGLEENVLKADLDLLIKMWQKVEKRMGSAPPRTMLHRDIPLPMKIARDFFTDDVEEMIIDSEEAYRSILDDCEFLSPMQRVSLELYRDKTPLFEKHGIEKEIERALSRKIWLDSGGYIFIDKTEAMYCIDINSGRFSGGSDLEETVFKVNQEAAREIARQIRLRNLSGMIVIDFIDMEAPGHRAQVLKTLRDGFKGDRNKPNILDFSELGLVQMTRRRTSASLDEVRKEVCPCCNGAGKILSGKTVANQIRNQVLDEAIRYQTEKNIHKRSQDSS